MSEKEQLKKALKEDKSEWLRDELRKSPAFIRKIQRCLYDLDEDVRWGAARAFGYASQVFDEERTRTLLRQLVWLINEESGNNCWFAPQAIGEIGRYRPEWVKDFIPCLLEFYKYPDQAIQSGLEYAFNIFREKGLAVGDD